MADPATKLQRSSGAVRVSFKRHGSKTVLDALYQQGCSKVRFPKTDAQLPAEAILINTSGGLTDGDCLACSASWRADTSALITTQAAERIYRSRGATASLHCRLDIGERADACWLPQETILFDGGRLDRTMDVFMASSARLLAAESIVFGRTDMGEVVRAGRLLDRWRIRIDDRLVFADAVLLDESSCGHFAQHLTRRSIANGAISMATLIYVGADCALHLDGVRCALDISDVVAGASDLGPLLVARMLAKNGRSMREAVARVFASIQDNSNAGAADKRFTLPRVWNC